MNLKKKLVAVVSGMALLLTMFAMPDLKVNAAEAKTYYLMYDVTSGKWAGSIDKVNWSDAVLSGMEDGDNVVVDANGYDTDQVTFTASKNIGELAFVGRCNAIVNAPNVNHVYAIAGATGVVNAHVGSADAYAGAVLQINGDVDKFTGNYGEAPTIFAVTGTVKAANVVFTGNILSNSTTIYNVAAGKLKTDKDGFVNIAEDKYSLTPSEEVTAPEAVSTPAAAETEKPVLDDVPNTGAVVFSEALIFLIISVVSALAAVFFAKKSA